MNHRTLPLAFLFTFLYLISNGQIASNLVKHEAPNRESYAEYGKAIAITDNWMLIGAPGESTDANFQSSISETGTVYFYVRNASGIWEFIQKIVPSQRVARGRFGWSMALKEIL